MIQKKKGFTLIELVIVIAILGILAAISVGRYSKYTEDARKKVCNINRQELTHAIEAELAAQSGETPQAAFDSLIESDKSNSACPEGGKLSCQVNADGSFEIVCSKHHEETQNLGTKGTMDSIVSAMKSASSSLVDSGAGLVSTTCETAKVQKKLKDAGIDLEALGAKSWSWSQSNSMLWWTPVDISTLNVGDSVPVMKYNANSKNYTVYWARIDTRTTATSDKSYNVLVEAKGYTPSTVTDRGNQTYEQALKRFHEISGK